MADHKELLKKALGTNAVPTFQIGDFNISPDEACKIIAAAVADGTIGPFCALLPGNEACKKIEGGIRDICVWCTDGDIGHAIACIALAIAILK